MSLPVASMGTCISAEGVQIKPAGNLECQFEFHQNRQQCMAEPKGLGLPANKQPEQQVVAWEIKHDPASMHKAIVGRHNFCSSVKKPLLGL